MLLKLVKYIHGLSRLQVALENITELSIYKLCKSCECHFSKSINVIVSIRINQKKINL